MAITTKIKKINFQIIFMFKTNQFYDIILYQNIIDLNNSSKCIRLLFWDLCYIFVFKKPLICATRY